MRQQAPFRDEVVSFGRRFLDALNAHDLSRYDEVVAPDFVEHESGPGIPPGREGARQLFQAMLDAFPDFRYEVDDELVDGDKLVLRGRFTGTQRGEFLGIPPAGRRLNMSVIDIIRYANGKAVEHWGVTDSLGMLEQLGAAPPQLGQQATP